MRLLINGAEREVTAAEDTPLLFVLHEELGLRAARFGCGQGLCGACTVLVDGTAIFSCDTPLWAVGGKAITTYEGLQRTGRDPISAALLAEQAGQCGYCLSGIVMRLTAVLRQSDGVSRDEAAKALARNLCRCGTHARVLKAVDRLLAERREAAAC